MDYKSITVGIKSHGIKSYFSSDRWSTAIQCIHLSCQVILECEHYVWWNVQPSCKALSRYDSIFRTGRNNRNQFSVSFHFFSSNATCNTTSTGNRRPRENDLLAVHYEKQWFRARCICVHKNEIEVLCIDSGATIRCSMRGIEKKYQFHFDNLCFQL